MRTFTTYPGRDALLRHTRVGTHFYDIPESGRSLTTYPGQMFEGMSVVINVMLSLMSVMSPHPALCNLSVRSVVKLCILGVLALGVSLVS